MTCARPSSSVHCAKLSKHSSGRKPLNTLLNFGIEFAMSLLVFGTLAKWYVWPFLRARPRTEALLILLVPFLPRYLGLASLVPGVVDPSVTQSTFALYQAYGDFIAFALAFVAFVLLHFRNAWAIQALWVFNIFGTLDFIHSVVRGILGGTGGSLGAFWYIPVCYVPLGLVAHCLIFVVLLRNSGVMSPMRDTLGRTWSSTTGKTQRSAKWSLV